MTLIRVISVLACLSYVFLLLLVRKEWRRREVRGFVLFLLGMLMWQLAVTAVTFTSQPIIAAWWYRAAMGPGVLFTVAYAQFVRDYLHIRSARWFMQVGYAWFVLSAIYILVGGPYLKFRYST